MPERALLARLVPALLMAMVLVLGIAKVIVGISRNRPVIFLVFLCIATMILVAVFGKLPAVRTRSGDRLMASLRRRNSALQATARSAPQNLADTDLALAIALFGPAVLASGALRDLRQALWPVNTSWEGGSSCGGASCGGGGGGCSGGGCGGGGCGGCGGG